MKARKQKIINVIRKVVKNLILASTIFICLTAYFATIHAAYGFHVAAQCFTELDQVAFVAALLSSFAPFVIFTALIIANVRRKPVGVSYYEN